MAGKSSAKESLISKDEKVLDSDHYAIQSNSMTAPNAPTQPPARVVDSEENVRESKIGKGILITVHGYMHKQGKRVIKGPIHKSWKRRYFALENSKIYYFQSHLECRQYFTTRNVDLVVGAVELKDATQLRPSARLDLPHKGFELNTKRRVWVLCPESEDEYQMWFHALENRIVTQGSGNVVERELPNVRKYPVKGKSTYRCLYFLFILAGILEIFGLVFWFLIGLQPCDISRPLVDCDTILETSMDKLTCMEDPINGIFTPPAFWLEWAGVKDVECFHKPPIGQWVSYFSLLFAEILSFFLASLYYLGMWKPVRRGARYLDEFQPKMPKAIWPRVDLLICHYSEPAEETIDTLAAAVQLEYPPHLLHIWILDDGYCKTKWQKGNPIPTVELNKGVLETAGDLRQEVAQFLYDRLCDPNDEIEVYAWRKLHSSANLPTPDRPRVVNRSDCAVGSFRDDYKYKDLPQITFVGRMKPKEHFSKAGNINNCLYNEGACGSYVCIFDNDMQPHPKFILATMPFFFDDEDRQGKMKFKCKTAGCSRVANICCASCKIAGVPEESISYCSKLCFDNAMHVQGDTHCRQVSSNKTSDKSFGRGHIGCSACGGKVDKQGTCKRCVGSSANIDVSSLHEYSDDLSVNSVGFVQTPQYFRDCEQLRIGDPLGHRNATFYDAIQTGQDGYECASFAGTNAIFRRQALDSVCGIQYGSLTEDAYTGQMLNALGWKALYFRKDFEGEVSERIRLAEGLIPDNVAGSLAQRKRWAKGNFQIFLRKSKDLVDPEWKRPGFTVPKNGKKNKFMRKIFYWNNTIYPIGSFSAILFYYITLYFLYTGYAPIFLGGLKLLIGLVPKLLIQGALSALSNRAVENNDVVRSQEAWFGYSWVHCIAVLEAIWWKITGKDSPWANTGGLRRGSLTELPNVLVFFATSIGVIWSVVRFFAAYNDRQTSHGASLLLASLLMGTFIAFKLAPSVRMSIQEYFGWSYQSLTDHGNFIGSSSIAFGLAFIAVWVYVEQPSSGPF